MVLVTGATGILGRVMVLLLLKRGRKVRATRRPGSNLQEVRSSYRFYTDEPEVWFDKIEWVTVDFEEQETLKAALQNVTEVYHCAARVSFHPDDRREMYRTNIIGTKNLLYMCENSSVEKFCFVSSIAVLDGPLNNGCLTETAEYNPKIDHTPYAKSKHFSEMEVWRACAEGLKTVIVNPGVIIGSGNWGVSSGELFQTFEKIRYTTPGSTQYVDVRDVAEISLQLMEKNIFGERFLLVAGAKKTVEVAREIRKKLQLSPPTVIPAAALHAGIWINKLFGWLLKPLRYFTKSNIEAATAFSCVSNTKIRERLNYSFIPVNESLDFHFKNYIADTQVSLPS